MLITNQFKRFALVGVANTLLDASIFAALHAGGLNVALANFISSSAGLLMSLVLNSRYTFKVKNLRTKQVVLFIAINLVGLWALQPLIISGLLFVAKSTGTVSVTQSQAMHNSFSTGFFASIAATGGTFLWNYFMYKKFVYTGPRIQAQT